jgi:hypothetical protein
MSGKIGRQWKWSKKESFQVDTPEKVRDFYDATRLYFCKERLKFITELYPELLKDSQEHIGELLGMERETVGRILRGGKL